MTLEELYNTFLYRDFNIVVVDDQEFDSGAVHPKMTFEKFLNEAEVLFILAGSPDAIDTFRLGAFIKDRFARAEVCDMQMMSGWLVVGIRGYEEAKE